MDLQAGFKEHVSFQKLFTPTDRILVAVSGGVDSMVLVDLLNTSGFSFALAHVNYQLRGRESDLDELLVQERARHLKVPVYVKRCETKLYAQSKGISMQMAARELRYQWFEELRISQNFQKIATAHHLNDVLETVLLNLTKGTGIAGLHGILPHRGLLVRPMIFATKEDILRYARRHQLSWRQDRSNDSDYYQRNLIRNKVVPLLKQINPDIEGSVKNTVEILRSIERHYRQTLDTFRSDLFKSEGAHIHIEKVKLNNMDPAIFTDLISKYGFNYEQCKRILSETIEHTGAIFQSSTHVLNIDRDEIIISPETEAPEVVEIASDQRGVVEVGDHQWLLEEHTNQQYLVSPDSMLGSFDLDKLLFPLKIRKWQPGDRFRPLGMKRQKKLSDFLIDAKVPRNYKTQVRVLLSGKDVIWVIGHRIDDRYKVTNETKRILEIQVKA
jgi:tRNA(Ile)-lysidine synthase